MRILAALASILLSACLVGRPAEDVPIQFPMAFDSPDVDSHLAGTFALSAGPRPDDLSFNFTSGVSSGPPWRGLVGSISGNSAYRPEIAADGHLRVEYHPTSDERIIRDNRGSLGIGVASEASNYTGFYFRSISIDIDPSGHTEGSVVLIREDRIDIETLSIAPGQDFTMYIHGTLSTACTRISQPDPGFVGVIVQDPELTNPSCAEFRQFFH